MDAPVDTKGRHRKSTDDGDKGPNARLHGDRKATNAKSYAKHDQKDARYLHDCPLVAVVRAGAPLGVAPI